MRTDKDGENSENLTLIFGKTFHFFIFKHLHFENDKDKKQSTSVFSSNSFPFCTIHFCVSFFHQRNKQKRDFYVCFFEVLSFKFLSYIGKREKFLTHNSQTNI